MEVKVVDDHIILSGRIDGGELPQLWSIAAQRRANPIRTVVLRDSPGGDLLTALQVGEYIRERGWNTAVSGYCFSGCALIYLGGKERGFTDDKPVAQTQLGFQGTYYVDTSYDRTPGSANVSGTIRARNWIKRRTDGRISDALLERFEALPPSDLVHFFDSSRRKEAAVLVCPLGKDGKRKCVQIPGTDVYREGIANSETVIRSNDRR